MAPSSWAGFPRDVWGISAGQFLVLGGATAMQPYYASYIISRFPDVPAARANLVLGTAYVVFAILGLWGAQIVHRLGVRTALLIGTGIYTLYPFALVWVPAPGFAIGAGAVWGLAITLVAVANSLQILTVTPRDRLGLAFGIVGSSSFLGITTGVLVWARLIGAYGYPPALMGAGLVSGCGGVLLGLVISRQRNPAGPLPRPWETWSLLLKNDGWRSIPINICAAAAGGIMWAAFSRHVETSFGLPWVGTVNAIYGAATILAPFVAGAIVDRRGVNMVVVWGFWQGAAGAILTAFVGHPVAASVTAVSLAVTGGCVHVATSAWTGIRFRLDDRPGITGAIAAMRATGTSTGILLPGLLASAGGLGFTTVIAGFALLYVLCGLLALPFGTVSGDTEQVPVASD